LISLPLFRRTQRQALGIDQALLGQEGEAYVELEGGCVCCQLSNELLDTLQMLRERVQPDRIIVETSGVALPFDIQLQFWRDPIRQWVDDDMALVVVNLVNGFHALGTLLETNEILLRKGAARRARLAKTLLAAWYAACG
jgi:G3E family GTPase